MKQKPHVNSRDSNRFAVAFQGVVHRRCWQRTGIVASNHKGFSSRYLSHAGEIRCIEGAVVVDDNSRTIILAACSPDKGNALCPDCDLTVVQYILSQFIPSQELFRNPCTLAPRTIK
ncbi:hypothetical protein E2C01_031133 [Portunus trituberculatus]|uniref:Uncharacterized protein n=1 Tax=Portunus trituberculatus TaxID=210409 RepID=A0A5B7EWU5_PORTR|nr:hypothetical protein [Portunus trituberculatus]